MRQDDVQFFDPDVVSRKFRELGLTVERGHDAAGTRYEPHRHEETHLFTVDGSVEISIEEGLGRS